MRILVVILSILLATTAVGCVAEQQEPTPDIKANADDQREATKQAERTLNATVEAEVKTTLQVQEAVRATMEARNGEQATEPAPTTPPTPWTEKPTPMVVQWPTATVSPEETRPTGNPTPTPYRNTGEDCDQLLRNQLVFQRGATTAGRMQEVIRQIQAQRDDCVPELWSPVVDDATAVLVTGCHGSANLPLYTSSLVARVGDFTIPESLYTGFTTTDSVRATSGRDSDNNVIVYWSTEAGRTPADGATCWLYVSRLNSWGENFGEEHRTEERTAREPVHYTRVTSPDDIDVTLEGEWYYIEIDEEGIYAEIVSMVTPGEGLMTTYGCSTIKQMAITEPIVKIRYTNRLPMELITLEESLQVHTIVGDDPLTLEWGASLTQDTDIKLTRADAQTLVQHIDATNAENYQIIFPHNPELDRIIPVKGLGTVVNETGLECFTGEIKDLELQPLMPPGTPQDPKNGRYTYSSPDQRFTFKYPADCGQMWESATSADNSEACPGDLNEINAWVETFNFAGMGEELSESPEWFTKDHVDKMAERYTNTSRYDLVTNGGHKLEVAEIEADEGYGPATVVAAAFTDSEWHFITIYMAYWSETSDLNQERVRAALRTFDAKYP